VAQPADHEFEPRDVGPPRAWNRPGADGDTLTLVSETLIDLVALARQGNRDAWETLVQRLQGVVWRATADAGLSYEDRQDVFAATFFRLFERLNDIREPAKLPGWLATTARNEVRQLMRTKKRLEPRDVVEPFEPVLTTAIDDRLLDGELRSALQAAFLRLGRPCQELLRLTTTVPPLSYDEISTLTGIARGSLGPNRQRCLEHLRHTPELRPFLEGARQ
jgi:RNA polymerase sigma factor (sigma-70 family)